MKIDFLKKEDEGKWDEFVNNHPEGRFVHLAAYKNILENTYGYKERYLHIHENEKILGIFPLIEFKNIFSKKKLVSLPFSEYGGILFEKNLTKEKKEEIIKTLGQYLDKFLSENKITDIEIRGQTGEDDLLKSVFASSPDGKIAVLRLDSYEKIYDKFDYQIKKALKKAEREGIKIYEDSGSKAIEKKFYPLYVKYLKERHGTPPHSLELFLNYQKFSPDNIKIYFAEFKGKIVAALFALITKNRVHITFNPSMDEYSIYRPNDLLHAKMIEWACRNNFQIFDFGPARYKGQTKYKMKWGAEFSDHFHFYYPKKNFPSEAADPEKGAMKFLSWAWMKLPLKITVKFGPVIRKKLGR